MVREIISSMRMGMPSGRRCMVIIVWIPGEDRATRKITQAASSIARASTATPGMAAMRSYSDRTTSPKVPPYRRGFPFVCPALCASAGRRIRTLMSDTDAGTAAMTFSGNALYHGDNLTVLRAHIPAGCAALIYLDPPFASQRDYALQA